MNEKMARSIMPIWAGTGPVHIHEERRDPPAPRRKRAEETMRRLTKRYGLFLALMCAWTISMILCSAVASRVTEREVSERLAAEYAQKLEAYKQEQMQAEQAAHWLSGDASREAFLNQEIDAAARLCAKMSNDTQKGGIICNALARMMSTAYPETMQEVVAQPGQWMFYDAGNKFSTHDRELAEKILRDYYDGIVPAGLTEDYVYGSWSESDYVLRNTWDFNSSTRTWRYQ